MGHRVILHLLSLLMLVFITSFFLQPQGSTGASWDVLLSLPETTPEPESCPVDPFGPAAGFNVFMLGDVTQTGVDTEGRLAAAGNITLSSYSVGDKLDPAIWSDKDVLIAGHDLTFTVGGRVYYGNAVYSDTANVQQPTVTIDGELRQDTPISMPQRATWNIVPLL